MVSEPQIAQSEDAEIREINWDEPITAQLDVWADRIEKLVEDADVETALADLHQMRAVDRAELTHTLADDTRATVLGLFSDEVVAEVLNELDTEEANELAVSLDIERLAHILELTSPTTAVAILRGLDWEIASAILGTLKVSNLLGDLFLYREDEAGGVMTPEVVALRESWNVSHAINFLRSSDTHPENVRQLFVVDGKRKLTGWLELSELIFASPSRRVRDIMHTDISAVEAGEDQTTAAAIAQRYNLLSVPVVGEEGELLGAITVDDIQRIAEEKVTEDFLKLASSSAFDSYKSPLLHSVRARLPWLVGNVFAALIVGVSISLFESTIATFAVLASHLAMLMSQAGVMGNQVNIVTIRSLAVGDISYRDALPLLLREYAIASINGTVVSGIMAVIVGVWRANWWLAFILFLATLAASLVSLTAAALFPLAMQKLKIDPAISSGTILSTINDLASSLIFLGLAALLISTLT